MNKRTYGLELEKPISDKMSQLPHGMTQTFFQTIEEEATKRHAHPHGHMSDVKPEITMGIISDDLGEQGIDNGFNIQETALPYTTDLSELNKKLQLDMKLVKTALENENATFLNMANHPFGQTTDEEYKKFVAPKGLYSFFKYRKITHRAGIDAKAQNSPATGVHASEAADAVSVMVGFGAAMIGLFANSPISNGKLSGFKESRMTMWHDYFSTSIIPGDLRTSQFPEYRFHTMAQYFTWIFGGDSGIYFVLGGGKGQEYKSIGTSVLVIENNPSVLSFLSKKEWTAHNFTNLMANDFSNPVTVTPEISHMEAMQFEMFCAARIRFGIKADTITPTEFVAAVMKTDQKEVEALFEKHASYLYIEGRDPGANFPDSETISAGEEIAKSVVISPSALQAGLIQNLPEAVALLETYNWKLLGKLRTAAIKDGLDGEIDGVTVKELAEKVVEVASKGLQKSEQWMLAYPKWVLNTGENGADRALKFITHHPKGGREAIVDLIKSREVNLTAYEN